MHSRRVITVFEHSHISVGDNICGVEFDDKKFESLVRHYGKTGVPYFSPVHKGVRFNNFVGAIQIGDLTIQVLPKADSVESEQLHESDWRDMLIRMILAARLFNIENPGKSSLKIIPNSILDLYFAIFVQKLRDVLHCGLVKQYRKNEGNVKALKGSIKFANHIRQNIVHQERFFVRHTMYDTEHKLHMILYKTLLLLKQINSNPDLHSEIGALLLDFPEMPDISITEATFSKIVFSRKTEIYRDLISIAKMILLKYHPDIKSGGNNVLALMFDMNLLWEKFVLVSLRKHFSGDFEIREQRRKDFWKPEYGRTVPVRPDIILKDRSSGECVVLDTKWKNLGNNSPSAEDLRQMYVYNDYYGARKTALIYPGKLSVISGRYFETNSSQLSERQCSVICLPVIKQMRDWQLSIADSVSSWIKS